MYAKVIKRILDFILSLCTIVILLPLFCMLMIIGTIAMKGNPFFLQDRPGKSEKVFKLIKFRTMTNEKDKDGNPLPDEKRLVPYGKFLRSTSLDELPELFNILLGQMAIIGPRPLAVIYLPYYTEKEHHRHDVRPGLTGLAQINGRNTICWEQKFKYDLEYIRTLCFTNDLSIFFRTIRKVLTHEGIGQGEEAPESLHVERSEWLDEQGKIKKEYQK